MKKIASIVSALAFAAIAAGVQANAADGSSWGPGADDANFKAMLKSGFRAKGIATLDRLDQDATQAFCSDPDRANSKESAAQKAKIEADNMAAIKWPSDGKWLGDWKEGEKLAQSGRGLTSTDKAGDVNGGNCYNCHQLSPKEISYGTIGPSLTNYARIKGVDEEAMRYVWGHIYDSKAYNACSNMPRAGYKGILTEKQIKDLMALLLDPNSPVNQ
ncbi:MAG: sulfur oxidation c-type cytochrome SoxX [Hyphomicrobiales bacterium]|nr:sulfur oxidation c-type cytochrome SoxX [Hyphomicrobiales bacterium]